MSVSNGQTANQTTFNNGFVSKTSVTVANTVTGIIGLNNTSDPNSGNQIFNTQRLINEVRDADGTAAEGDVNRKVYSSNNVVANGDDRKIAIGKLDAEFDAATGHDHNGVNSKAVSASNLDDFNTFFSAWQTFTVTGAVGIDDDVSVQLAGKTPGGGASAVGVPTSAPYNRCEIKDSALDTYIEDAGGQRVYGRLTEAAGVWTLTYYTNEAGVETSHSLASTNIRVYFREVFDQDTRPTFSEDLGLVGSLDLTADIIDASLTQRGAVSTGAQSFAGKKTFDDGLSLSDDFQTPLDDEATAATITALTYRPAIRFTGATATSLQGIASGLTGRRLLIHNASSADITLEHEHAGASASNRLKLPDASDVILEPDKSIEVIYDATQSRWVLKSGSGGSAGFTVATGTATLTDNTASPTAIDSRSATTYKGFIIDYVFTRAAGQAKTGRFYATTDGTSAAYSDQGADLGTSGVTFSADISGGNLRFLYTTTSTGTNGLLRYEIKEILTP